MPGVRGQDRGRGSTPWKYFLREWAFGLCGVRRTSYLCLGVPTRRTGLYAMRISDVLTKPAAETRVKVKQYRFRLRDVNAVPDVWLDSGNLADWLGDAISRVECVAAHELVSAVPPIDGETLFEAYLDGELVGEIRDDASGRTYYALA
jgi:hypothetical protein